MTTWHALVLSAGLTAAPAALSLTPRSVSSAESSGRSALATSSLWGAAAAPPTSTMTPAQYAVLRRSPAVSAPNSRQHPGSASGTTGAAAGPMARTTSTIVAYDTDRCPSGLVPDVRRISAAKCG